MKAVRFFCVLAMACTLFACSGDSDTDAIVSANEKPLVRRITYTKFNTGGGILIQDHRDFYYENRILSHIINHNEGSSDFLRNDYSFEDDKLLTITTTQTDYPDAGGISTFVYEGDSLQRMESVAYPLEWHTQHAFEYQGDDLVVNVYGAPTGQTEPMELISRSVKVFENGNLITINQQQITVPATLYSVNHYSYDQTNNPFKNMNRFFRMTYNSPNIHPLSNNNYLTESDDSGTIWYDFEVICNAQQYPIKIKRHHHQDNRVLDQTEIEYF